MYARGQGENELTFDFAEGLIKNNLLMVDRETRSVWSQLHGRAVSGPREGQPLQALPAIQSTWGFWKNRHPDTRVMVNTKRPGRPYFYRTWTPGQPRPEERPIEHNTIEPRSRCHFWIDMVVEDTFLWLRKIIREPHGVLRRLNRRWQLQCGIDRAQSRVQSMGSHLTRDPGLHRPTLLPQLHPL